ncbi:hypothetical protein N0V82_004035 [Gnomoniopsis sp. IMI 355080]|nr:hypothetical protein N0V82_004035 [Gnomoniopsis sp. IMI 355080]
MDPTPEKYLSLPYEQRWEALKPVIVKMFLDDNTTIPKLSKRMDLEFSFKAEDHHYRYQFKKWNIRKRTTTVEKEAVITACGKKRAQHEFGTSNVKLQQGLDGDRVTKSIDKKQLKRYINDSIRKASTVFIRPGLFIDRDLPYAALARGHGGDPAYDRASPGGPQTPGYITVSSPPNHSPDAGFQQKKLSPTTQLLHKKVLMDRAQLLMEGREMELMRQMNQEEKETAATWLHDFWMFSFVTAKYWGKGPKDWTPALIAFKTFAGVANFSPGHSGERRELTMGQSPSIVPSVIDPPTQLCNWSIHLPSFPRYEAINSPPRSPTDEDGDLFDVEDEATWRGWDGLEEDRDLPSTITKSLQDNSFSRVQPEDLPFEANRVVDIVSGPPNYASVVEAFGFAIMSRNVETLEDIEEKHDELPSSLRSISPFHLAAKFLDGSRACCGVMNNLLYSLSGDNSIGVNYTDSSGLTVMDTLFVSVLRSHSSVTPLMIGGNIATSASFFRGADVDICGRWDADSPSIRHLHAIGKTAIPHEWKHMFCHTSVQAVCHSLTAIFMPGWRPNINTPSGLFLRRCHCCGLELRLGPLHALVVVAFFLANSGLPGETLFGMIACMVCLLTLKAESSPTAEISVPALLDLDENSECQHSLMNAAELASAVPYEIVHTWTPEVQLGWEAITELLDHCAQREESLEIAATGDSSDRFGGTLSHEAEAHWDNDVSDGDPDSEADDACHHIIHQQYNEIGEAVACGDKRLGTIWAAIQVELLNYRRLEEGDPWPSSLFKVGDVVEELRSKDDRTTGNGRLMDNFGEGAVQAFSRCGLIYRAKHPGCVRREEACITHFANLEDWKRTTFINARDY